MVPLGNLKITEDSFSLSLRKQKHEASLMLTKLLCNMQYNGFSQIVFFLLELKFNLLN